MLLVLSRAMAVAGMFLTFGTLLVRIAIAEGAPARPARILVRLQWAAIAAAVVATTLWAATECADMAATANVTATVALLPDVLGNTVFGRLMQIRLSLLALIAVVLVFGRFGLLVATILAGGAVMLQAAHLHAFAMMEGLTLLLLAEALHVLAAGAWLGGLPALLVAVAGSPPAVGADVARRFSFLGIACVVGVSTSAVLQGWVLSGGWAGLFGTWFGWTCLAKLILFVVLLGLAARNRLHVVPRLAVGQSKARMTLIRHIIAGCAVGALVLLLASFLSELPPGFGLVNGPPP